ncbi:MAG: T9SS type A sorting domain-containing protein, partial [Prolixibacteraceae bacterium]|nr:T9SS type A sorting domain-containing protein [Prolixibacteraceae bacterium]
NAGNDVSPITGWRSTMLANAAKDPFWLAKVKHEGIENEHHKEALENVCTRCHAPMGMFNALLESSAGYSLDDLKNDPLGQDGISCTFCHQVNDFPPPLYSGNLGINNQKEIYGPFVSPITQQMIANTGFTPTFSERINDSRLCGTCHTLLTNSVDENGDFTGEMFVEQAIYHEWENSVFGAQNTTCQSCHLPRIEEGVKISSRPGFVAEHSPFGKHNFTGGNVFMLNLLKDNHDELGLKSGVNLMDETINRTKKLLSESTVELTLNEAIQTNDSIFITVNLQNKVGHKFPSGYPSRRAFLECVVTNGADTVFHSGKPGKGALGADKDDFEPHHKIISNEEQVQIYELVMGDTDGDVTTILERAYAQLKDNRMPPVGFSDTHANYDTVRIVGKAENDNEYFSGTGIETVTYSLPLSKIGAQTQVKVSLFYETVPESWVHTMFEKAEEAEEIASFREMYFNADRTPVFIAADSLQFAYTGNSSIENTKFKIYPNPTTGKIKLDGIIGITSFSVFTLNGKLMETGCVQAINPFIEFSAPDGNYILMLMQDDKIQSEKLILRKN